MFIYIESLIHSIKKDQSIESPTGIVYSPPTCGELPSPVLCVIKFPCRIMTEIRTNAIPTNFQPQISCPKKMYDPMTDTGTSMVATIAAFDDSILCDRPVVKKKYAKAVGTAPSNKILTQNHKLNSIPKAFRGLEKEREKRNAIP